MQLVYPGFLVWLLVVAIPIIIHLLQLRRPQRLLFTNTAFIREVELVTVRHRNLQQWLLLATRVLGLIALVLLFCQPFIPAKKQVTEAVGTEVLVDNSFSMQGRSAGQNSLLADAVSQARSIGQKNSGGGLRLINTGGKLLASSAYQAALDALKPSAANPLSKLRNEVGGQLRVNNLLYVFSDFQKSTADMKMLAGLEHAEVVLVPVAKKASGNLYVDSVWLDDAFVRVRANVGLHIRVRNGGEEGVNGIPVKVFLGARQVAAYQVTVAAGQAATSVVQVQVADGALALGRVVTEDAPVTFDNTYYFTLQPAAAVRVLEIGAEPVAQQVYSNEPLFAYSFATLQAVDYGALQRANLVLIHEVERIDAGLREGLRMVVKRGGSVVVVPTGTVSSHDSYQQLFRALGLGTVQWEAATATPELREVAVPSPSEPFFRNVFGAQQRAITMPRVAPVLRWSRTGTDILRLRDGESYLANFASGAGQVYVFSAPFARQYSDFLAHALFVPVMYRMAMRSYQNEQLPAYRLTQSSLTLKVPAAEVGSSVASRADEANFRLVKDSVVLIPAQRVVTNDLQLDLPVGMDAPGFYQVQRGGKVLTTLAFNQDKRESELAAYSADELRQLIGPNHPNIKVVESGLDGTGLAKFQAEQTGQPLWRYCLVLVLLALLAEALLVRFGGRKAVAPKVAVAA